MSKVCSMCRGGQDRKYMCESCKEAIKVGAQVIADEIDKKIFEKIKKDLKR